MKDEMTAVESLLDTAKLHEPPHILSQLLEIRTGDFELEPAEQEQLLEHLVDCDYCQTALAMLVDSGLANDNASDSSKNAVRELLARQRGAMQKKHAHYEQIAAYIQTLEEQGKEEADKKYSVLVEHLQHCKECYFLMENTRALLRQMAESELEQPRKVNTKPL